MNLDHELDKKYSADPRSDFYENTEECALCGSRIELVFCDFLPLDGGEKICKDCMRGGGKDGRDN